MAAGVAVAFLASLAGPADAVMRKQPVSQDGKKSNEASKSPFGDTPKGPLQMVVSIGHQHVTLYANGVRVGQARVSTGTPGHPTPLGVFSVIEKDRWHRSNLYGAAPMFYMQRLTWSGVAMHEGVLPGYAASHGCIRMPTEFASRLWVITRLGVRVVVARNDPEPYEFAHPKLFNPSQKPTPGQVSEIRPLGGPLPAATASGSTTGSVTRPIMVAQAAVVDDDAVKGPEINNQSSKAVIDAGPRSAGAAPADDARPIVRQAESIEAPPPPPAPAEVETSPATPATQAPASLGAPTRAAIEGPAPAAAAEASAEPEKREPSDAEPNKPLPSRNRAAEPTKRAGQVAVFVSKREKKIFVRQGFVPLFEMPVEIADPDQPLGTHVFTAMEIEGGGARMRWNAITMPPEQSRTADPDNRRRSAKKGEPAPRPGVELKPPSTAAQALDRIRMPQEAIERISEILTPGSSLIVSDHGLGSETGRYTEFIVLTR